MRERLPHRDGEKLERARGFHVQGEFDQAQVLYEKLLRKHPRNPVVQSLLGTVLVDQGQAPQAVPLLRRSLNRNNNPDGHYNLGLALDASGDLPAAIGEYERAIALNPQHTKAYFNLGLAYRRQDQHEHAIEALLQDYVQAAKFDTCRLLARSYLALERYDDALYYANQCVELEGANAEDLNTLIFLLCHKYAQTAFVDTQAEEELIALAQHAVTLNPTNIPALINAGRACSLLGHYRDALDPLKHAVQLDPENESAHALYAIALLTCGEIFQGWHERTLISRMRKPVSDSGVQRWNGELREGLKLWVTSEQGVGDQILYARMFEDLLNAGVQPTLVCEARMIPIMQRSFPDLAVTTELDDAAQKQHDAFTTMGEMHLYLRRDQAAIPTPSSYLLPDAARSAQLRQSYRQAYADKIVTGLAWHSHSGVNGAGKSVSLDDLLPILKDPGRVFVCVQYGEGWQQLADHAEQHDYTVHFDEGCNSLHDLDAGLAQLAALDELVSVSNASVHLAAAAGIKVHALIGRRPVWHWFSQGDTSPWYCDIALYRQENLRDWQAPIAKLHRSLAASD